MAVTASPAAGLTRDELNSVIEPLVARVAAVEARRKSERDEADVVGRNEFRMFKWLGTFALAAVLGGFGLLYEQAGDIRVGMERLRNDLLKEIHALRSEMHAEHSALRGEITEVRERVIRVETLLEDTGSTKRTEGNVGVEG